MRRRFSLVLVLIAALTASAVAPVRPQPAPNPKPTPIDVSDIVTDLISAGRSAASNVYIVHQYGANLGLGAADVAQFDIKYVKLSADANAMLDALAFSVATNHVDQAKVQAAFASVLAEAKDLDAAVAAVQSKGQSSNATQFGLPILDLLKAVLPLFNPVISAATGVVGIATKSRTDAAGERATLATQIRQEYWPNVKVAATGVQPTPAPAASR